MAIKTETISSIKSLLDVYRTLYGETKKLVWYRGQSKDDPSAPWPLVPRVYRLQVPTAVLGEIDLNTLFRLHAPVRSASCPPVGSDINIDANWLTLMQHYGLPTRLLDWTESILTAAYFAVATTEPREKDLNGVIWALQPDLLNRLSAGTYLLYLLGEPGTEMLIRRASLGDLAGVSKCPVLAVYGSHIDMRMMLQQSAFTIHDNRSPLETQDKAHAYLKKIIVPTEHKDTIKNELEILGIRRSTLFPDLDSLAKDLGARWGHMK